MQGVSVHVTLHLRFSDRSSAEMEWLRTVNYSEVGLESDLFGDDEA